ncbi:MAG: DUF2203 domain-containing protein [Candidatus Omnitrophota bacterium]
MPHFDKHFSLNEANSLIPRLREIFHSMRALLEEAREFHANPSNLAQGLKGRTNGTQFHHVRRRNEFQHRLNSLVSEIADQGIVIQDIERGLIDFPSIIEGEEVFLCYELSDGDEIQFWHELDAGYAGRKSLPVDFF